MINKKQMLSLLFVLSLVPAVYAFHEVTPIDRISSEIPLQIEKMTIADQEYLHFIKENATLSEAYSSLMVNGVFKSSGENHFWLYRHSDQSLGYDYVGSNSAEAFCNPPNTSEYCTYLIMSGNTSEAAVHAAVIQATEDSYYRDLGHYTRYHVGSTFDNLPAQIKHSWATQISTPDNVEFAIFDMERHCDNFRNNIHPYYQNIVEDHILNDVVKNQNGDIQYLEDGVTPQKIHPNGINC